MKCPLSTAVDYEDEVEVKFHTADCLQEKCAWWNSEHQMCAICHIGDELGELQWEFQTFRETIKEKLRP